MSRMPFSLSHSRRIMSASSSRSSVVCSPCPCFSDSPQPNRGGNHGAIDCLHFPILPFGLLQTLGSNLVCSVCFFTCFIRIVHAESISYLSISAKHCQRLVPQPLQNPMTIQITICVECDPSLQVCLASLNMACGFITDVIQLFAASPL